MRDIKETENTQKTSTTTHDFSPKASDWGFLNPMFLGKIRLCDKEGRAIEDSPVVTSLALDADLSIESQYNSPFENSNPESRLPVLMGMLQAGDWVNTVDKLFGGLVNAMGKEATGLSDDVKDKMNQLEGRTNFTKINSTQIYVSSSSARLNAVLFFEAWRDGLHEVEHQVAMLQQWSLPAKLANGFIDNMLDNPSIESIFPSEVPPFVSFSYGKKRYSPLLLESVAAPLITPMDSDGNRLVVEVNVTLVSRQAFDKANIKDLY